MRILVATEAVHQRIKEIRAYARDNIISLAEVVRRVGDQSRHIGDDPNYRLEIPFGFRVVYSEERQTAGLCAHISISVDAPGKLPEPIAVQAIMALFGVRTLLPECLYVWTEALDGGDWAVNVLAIIKEDA